MRSRSNRSRSLADEISEMLRDAIIRGELQPGQRIVESKVAAENGISQAPVREALLRLRDEYLVVTTRHRGTFVSEFSTQEIYDLYALREVMDELALRRSLRHMAETDLEHLEELVKAIEHAVEQASLGSNKLVDIVGADMEFHDYIYKLANHDFLYHIWKLLRNKISRAWFSLNEMVYSDLTELAALHKAIINALRSRDFDKIREANRFHLEHTTKLLRYLTIESGGFEKANISNDKFNVDHKMDA